MAEWVYLGEWGKVTPEIAKSNNRTNYKINITLKENLEQYLKQLAKKETLFGLDEKTRRAFFKELGNAETRAMMEADQLYPPEYKENVYKNTEKNDELTKKYHAEVREKYNISKELQWKIVDEGVKENWPLE